MTPRMPAARRQSGAATLMLLRARFHMPDMPLMPPMPMPSIIDARPVDSIDI